MNALALAQQLQSGTTTSVEATRACLARIAAVEPKLHAFITIDEAGALAAARASDERRGRGHPISALDGVPVAVKDALCTANLKTTAGSKMLANFIPPTDATVVARLKAAGTPILGKLNQDEFAMGSSTENSAFGLTRNPWNLARTPGGSSGGSAAAVAARECFASLGSDTGGSIRQPAAFCGVVGLKPTYGRVSRSGLIAFASSLDQVGPLARSVADVAAMLQIIAGYDPADATSDAQPTPDFSARLELGVKGLKLGLPREYFVGGLDPEVEASVRAAAAFYEKAGATLVEVSLPHTKAALATYYMVSSAEAASNLARYDGVRYGHRATGAKALRELYVKSRSEAFGPEVKRRIMLGTFALSAGYADAYYGRAQQVRTLVRRDFDTALSVCDALLAPVSPVPPFVLGEKVTDPMAMYLTDVFTVPTSLAGLPGLSLPSGFTADGLPLGVQLIGRPFDEASLLQIAHAYEREHQWHLQTAPT